MSTQQEAGTIALAPPPATTGVIGWMRLHLFSNFSNTVLSVLAIVAIVMTVPAFIDWAFLGAVWSAPNSEPCKAADGACWAIITEKNRLILFGRYSFDDQWRPLLGVLVLIAMLVMSCNRRFWKVWLPAVWLGGAYLFVTLMFGSLFIPKIWTIAPIAFFSNGLFFSDGLIIDTAIPDDALSGGMIVRLVVAAAIIGFAVLRTMQAGGLNRRLIWPWVGVVVVCWALIFGWLPFLAFWQMAEVSLFTYVPPNNWGGFPLTMLFAVFGLMIAFPVSVLMALGRRSDMPAVRSACVVYIEFIRGVPLITLLFMGAFMLPLFLPAGMNFNDLIKALVAFILFSAAYMAEVVRGGLQAIPKGQYEAAAAMGLTYWQMMRKVILPQALKITIPAQVNTFIGFFKDTSLVLIIGLTDLLGALRLAIGDAEWRPIFVEAYLYVALIYWIPCYAMSKYSQYLERQLDTGHKR